MRVISCKNGKMTFEVDIAEGQSFLESEEEIMDTVNAVGREMTAQSLQAHDVNAERIVLGEITAYSKGLSNEVYQSPYGPIEIPRHVFQTSQGGRIDKVFSIGSAALRDEKNLIYSVFEDKFNV